MNAVGLRMIAGCAIGAGCAVGVPVIAQAQATAATAALGGNSNDGHTVTPIKHVIYIIGENRTFDHVFATWVPPKGQKVWNLLSEGIVNADGTPGPNYKKAQQWQAIDENVYAEHPVKTAPYSTLPAINTDGAPKTAPATSIAEAKAVEPALWSGSYVELTTGGTGQASDVIDTRFPQNLPDGPFQISRYASYDSYTSSPVHRFWQMWQQQDCDMGKATAQNPSGCQNDLFPWVEVQIGAGSNGKPLPAGFTNETTGEGSTSMGFWNVQAGDAPYFTSLANEYAVNDNFHQAIAGGTGANHIAVGYGTTIFYADSNGNPATPPINQIENPAPAPGTNDWYTQDGYSGGSYMPCDPTANGVRELRAYLETLPYKVYRNGNCRAGAYYIVNNYNPGYLGTGQPAPLGPNVFTIPPSKQRNIGLLLSENHISWKYYGEGWANGAETGEASTYCNICNPFLYSTQIMTNPKLRANLQDITDLYNDINNGTLPAVSIVKPDGLLDGHPASSKYDLFEEFSKKIVQMIQNHPAEFAETAIIITEDEGGGYWDSGYEQPLDYFGDGTRIPMLVVSPFSKGVGVVHSYGDHVSFAKFVEANWGLQSISIESRDNLPNPITTSSNPYAPTNAPAISDLMNMFNFDTK
jgi:phospholipase C